MVRHITMWKLRDFAWGNDKETNYELSKQQGLALKDKFPKLLHTEFHRGFKCGGQNYDMVNILEFATREDLEEFLASPLHQQALLDMFAREAVAPMFERMVATDAVHALRRAREIESMAQVLETDNSDSTMSRAAAKKLYWSANSGMKQAFAAHIPTDYRAVVRYLENYQKSSRQA